MTHIKEEGGFFRASLYGEKLIAKDRDALLKLIWQAERRAQQREYIRRMQRGIV